MIKIVDSIRISGTCNSSVSLVASGVTMTRLATLVTWIANRGRQCLGALPLIFLTIALVPAGARASCTSTTTGVVSFSPTTTITVAYNAAVGTVLYTSPLIAPTNASSLSCTGTTNYGVIDSVGATPGTGVQIYPTSVPGLGFSITHGDLTTYLFPYPCCQLPAGSYNATTASSLQLIKTGPIVSGSTLPSGQLGYWQFDNSQKVETFNLVNSVTIIDPACSVTTTPINVTLPNVDASALKSVGSAAGATAFAIALSCSSGATLDVQLNYAGANSTIPGVLTATGGTAAGVGVQLLDRNFSPVVFGATTVVGATPAGPLTIPYYARYYRTAAITPGTIAASATFTLSYQ